MMTPKMSATNTAQAAADYMSTKPGLAIGFPIFAEMRCGAATHRLTQADKDAYVALGLIRDILPGPVANPSVDEAARGWGFDARLTDLGTEVAALLA